MLEKKFKLFGTDLAVILEHNREVRIRIESGHMLRPYRHTPRAFPSMLVERWRRDILPERTNSHIK